MLNYKKLMLFEELIYSYINTFELFIKHYISLFLFSCFIETCPSDKWDRNPMTGTCFFANYERYWDMEEAKAVGKFLIVFNKHR